jgi:hypothetical protein
MTEFDVLDGINLVELQNHKKKKKKKRIASLQAKLWTWI